MATDACTLQCILLTNVAKDMRKKDVPMAKLVLIANVSLTGFCPGFQRIKVKTKQRHYGWILEIFVYNPTQVSYFFVIRHHQWRHVLATILCICLACDYSQQEKACMWTKQPDASSTDEKLGQSSCFKIKSFDIMLDSTLRMQLKAVNYLPSWGMDSPLEDSIKSQAITQACKVLNIKSSDGYHFESAAK